VVVSDSLRATLLFKNYFGNKKNRQIDLNSERSALSLSREHLLLFSFTNAVADYSYFLFVNFVHVYITCGFASKTF
jgi:hypothetical protein